MNPQVPPQIDQPVKIPVPPPAVAGTSTMADTEEKLGYGLSAISLTNKIPDFWADQPRVWFIRTEAILAPQKMGDDSKFNIVVSKLTKDAIQQVSDLLIDPPKTNKFESLKARLLQIYEESENRKIQKLIGEMELGEQKPSQLLRRMRDLARGKIPDETLRILWQGHLPPAARAVLAVTENVDLESLCDIADKIQETTRPENVAEVSQVSSDQCDKIMAEIAKINVRLNQMDTRSRSIQRDRGNKRSSYRTRSASRQRTPNSPDWLCFYHYRFKNRAKKCEKPCAWKTPEN
ncbi:uncharacterized protein LOC132903262 [Amyelois transitella]|uniref:uncharacterized protein LOC132903262 n=1 Tax=Amyelois transitella TaxID=680683 RepID=UPI00299078A8|nr:uncharacterized protein LOC132903262 [Amyelois transitella]